MAQMYLWKELKSAFGSCICKRVLAVQMLHPWCSLRFFPGYPPFVPVHELILICYLSSRALFFRPPIYFFALTFHLYMTLSLCSCLLPELPVPTLPTGPLCTPSPLSVTTYSTMAPLSPTTNSPSVSTGLFPNIPPVCPNSLILSLNHSGPLLFSLSAYTTSYSNPSSSSSQAMRIAREACRK